MNSYIEPINNLITFFEMAHIFKAKEMFEQKKIC